MSIQNALQSLHRAADPARALSSKRFFKTNSIVNDHFLGVRVPVVRKIAKACFDLRVEDVLTLLHSTVHEERLLALLIWVGQFVKFPEKRECIHTLYMANCSWVNNWDLVDTSAPTLVGAFLQDREQSLLFELSSSPNLWERRIAIIATQTYIRAGRFKETLELARILLCDEEDLIHKAVGWMLREVGERDRSVLEHFLKKNLHVIPRTMLRYAIEKFPEAQRKAYLSAGKEIHTFAAQTTCA